MFEWEVTLTFTIASQAIAIKAFTTKDIEHTKSCTVTITATFIFVKTHLENAVFLIFALILY